MRPFTPAGRVPQTICRQLPHASHWQGATATGTVRFCHGTVAALQASAPGLHLASAGGKRVAFALVVVFLQPVPVPPRIPGARPRFSARWRVRSATSFCGRVQEERVTSQSNSRERYRTFTDSFVVGLLCAHDNFNVLSFR